MAAVIDLALAVVLCAICYNVGRWNEEIRMARWRLLELRRLDQVIRGLRDADDDQAAKIDVHLTVAHALLQRSLEYPSDDIATRWRVWLARRQAIREVTR